MAKYTPGPWTTRDTEIIATQFSECIAIVQYPGHGANEEAEGLANAHLIAAAPDLLVALENVLRRSGVDLQQDQCDEIRAAIAKAKGRTPWKP